MLPLTEIALSLLTTLFIVLYLRELLLRHQLTRDQATHIEQARQNAQQIINDAVKKSQEMISQAESSSIRVITDSKVGLGKGQALYDAELKQILEQLEESIANELRTTHTRLANSQASQEKFLAELEDKLARFQKNTELTVSKNATQATEGFKDQLSEALRQIRDDATSAVQKDLQDERAVVHRYQEDQIKTVQEHLVATLERTLEIVLTKRLNLNDHLDLVKESFDEARKEKFLP